MPNKQTFMGTLLPGRSTLFVDNLIIIKGPQNKAAIWKSQDPKYKGVFNIAVYGKIIGTDLLDGLDKNPWCTRSGVDRLYCTIIAYLSRASVYVSVASLSSSVPVPPLSLPSVGSVSHDSPYDHNLPLASLCLRLCSLSLILRSCSSFVSPISRFSVSRFSIASP